MKRKKAKPRKSSGKPPSLVSLIQDQINVSTLILRKMEAETEGISNIHNDLLDQINRVERIYTSEILPVMKVLLETSTSCDKRLRLTPQMLANLVKLLKKQ